MFIYILERITTEAQRYRERIRYCNGKGIKEIIYEKNYSPLYLCASVVILKKIRNSLTVHYVILHTMIV